MAVGVITPRLLEPKILESSTEKEGSSLILMEHRRELFQNIT